MRPLFIFVVRCMELDTIQFGCLFVCWCVVKTMYLFSYGQFLGLFEICMFAAFKLRCDKRSAELIGWLRETSSSSLRLFLLCQKYRTEAPLLTYQKYVVSSLILLKFGLNDMRARGYKVTEWTLKICISYANYVKFYKIPVIIQCLLLGAHRTQRSYFGRLYLFK